ncbi:MAG: hypothetical protein IJA34_09330 [Lachnospiraceae bacterium]|nr:hypothetical protein [Lachnospiraceae bacterium]
MKQKLEIIFSEYDNENYIVFVKRNEKNLFMDLGICDFEKEMEYWDMPTKIVNYKGEKGYLFSYEIDKIDVKEEIRRFVIHNNI